MLEPTPKMKKWRFAGALILALLTVGTTTGIAFDKSNRTLDRAIRGYDTVAYHTENRAVKGNSDFYYEWNDAEWHFASVENRDLFAAAPDRYAPQFGGLWASALAFGQVVHATPTVFKIVDGKLYLNSTDGGRKSLNQKKIKMAHEEWAKINKEN